MTNERFTVLYKHWPSVRVNQAVTLWWARNGYQCIISGSQTSNVETNIPE